MGEELKQAFDQFRNGSELFVNRTRQINAFRPIARDVLAQLVAKGSVTNEDLTGLIHLFRPKPVGELANKYLAHLVSDKSKANELSEQLQATGLGGYTAPGRLKIHDLSTEQLRDVHSLLRDAFNVTTSAEASQLCADYDRKKVTYVTPGIYSPWLHYIQPELFPILNDATKAFFNAQGLPVEYPALITRVPELSQSMGVKDLGLLDAFAWGQQDDQAPDPKGGTWRSAKWIKRVKRDDWNLFLDACGEVIQHFGLSQESPLLAMNLNSNPSEGLRMNVSNRATLGLLHIEGTEVMVMLPKGTTRRLFGSKVISSGAFSRPANAEATHISMDSFQARFHELREPLFQATEELLGRSQSSPFRKHYIPDLYRMATDADFREKTLDYLLEGKGEWPGISATPVTSYWIFQSNPKWYDAIGALRDNAVDRWSIDVHKQKIKTGDKAIIWITGKEGGCCALATVNTPVQPMDQGPTSYARSPDFAGVHDRVGITIDHNLWDRPISKSEAIEHVEGLKAGNQGTTFSATKEQYDFFLQRATANKANAMHDLNTILYGPPGTGKTYHTVTNAVAIIEQSPVARIITECAMPAGRKQVRERFEGYRASGQVKSVTFHQSFSYEDFVEGIKPVLGATDTESNVSYELRDGVFKAMCLSARSALKLRSESGHAHPVIEESVRDNATFWKASIGYYTDPEDDAIFDYCMENDVFAMGWGEGVDMADAQTVEAMAGRLKDNGVNTDGRVLTFLRYLRLEMKKGDLVFVSEGNDTVRAIGIVDGDYFMNKDAPIRYKQFRKVKWIYKNLELPVADFYGNAFTQGTLWRLKPHLVRRGYFAPPVKKSGEADQRYVLVIDEINRGNIAAIFGELITLIEEDKREGMLEAVSVRLPYSKTDDFSVPPNLHILGTMNTADRSVEALDTALRRRFSFVEMPSKPELIDQPEDLTVDLRLLLTTMNARIEQLLDRDHHIGHSYFMGIANAAEPEAELKRVFKNKVLPLLEEYFYGDAVKVGMVLGKAFVPQPVKKKGTPFAEGYRSEEVETKAIYRINDPETLSMAHFESIYA